MRYCLTPGCPELVTKGRCPAHRPTEEQRGYGREWRRVRKAVVQAQPWCSWCGATSDLVADHVVSGDPSALQTLCRSCNSKKVHLNR